jgi:hypothetical protein
MHRAAPLLALLAAGLWLAACEPKPPPSLDGTDVFFNSSLIEGILGVEEAERPAYLTQYIGRSISARAKLMSMQESLPTDVKAKWGAYEGVALAQDIYRDIDVEYRLYMDDKSGKELLHRRSIIRFTGAVKEVEWVREGDNRLLRVHLSKEKVEPLEE